MNNFANLLTDLRAAIAVVAARDRRLTVLLVAVWGRVSRVAQRMERLFARWQAGTLLLPRTARVGLVAAARERVRFPSGRGWLIVPVRDAGAYGSQLAHLIAQPEFAAFLAAVPQAGRVLRPLMRMLSVEALPEVICRTVVRVKLVAAGGSVRLEDGVVMGPVRQISGG